MKNPENITCIQLWKRYHNADERSDKLRYEWKHTVSKLHDTEIRIDMVKETLRKEYEKLPAKELKKAIPLDVQEKIFFLRHELAALCGLRKELHAIIIIYKRQCEEATTRANRYLMAHKQVESIIRNRIPSDTINRVNEIYKYPCTLYTNNRTGNITVVLKGEGENSDIEIKY